MKDKERKDLIIKQTTVLRKPLIFVVISLLAIALILNSSSRFDVFAKPKLTRGPISCQVQPGAPNFTECCQTETDKKGIEIEWCTICDNTDPPSHCGPRYPQQGVQGLTTPTTDCTKNPNDSSCKPKELKPKVDCTTNPDDPSCATKLKPKVDCSKNSDDPLCKTAGITPPEIDCTKNPNDPSCKPTELKPTVDCSKNSDDPLCKTAGITRDSKSK
jgi:hypothetical protein